MNLTFKAGDQKLKLNFSPSPVDEIFVKHPQMLVNCSLLAAATAGYITYDTVVNESARNWSPLLSGRDYKLTVSDLGFKLNVPKIDVKNVHDAILFSLKPTWLSNALAFQK